MTSKTHYPMNVQHFFYVQLQEPQGRLAVNNLTDACAFAMSHAKSTRSTDIRVLDSDRNPIYVASASSKGVTLTSTGRK